MSSFNIRIDTVEDNAPSIIRPASDAGEQHVPGVCPAWSDGWHDGAPLGVPAKVVAIDRLLYRRSPCPRCKARSNTVRPQHRKHAYRLLLVCAKCGHEHIA
jgi:hypothetical protein